MKLVPNLLVAASAVSAWIVPPPPQLIPHDKPITISALLPKTTMDVVPRSSKPNEAIATKIGLDLSDIDEEISSGVAQELEPTL